MRYITSAVLRVRAQLDALLFVWSLFCYHTDFTARGWNHNTAPEYILDSVQPT